MHRSAQPLAACGVIPAMQQCQVFTLQARVRTVGRARRPLVVGSSQPAAASESLYAPVSPSEASISIFGRERECRAEGGLEMNHRLRTIRLRFVAMVVVVAA